MNIIRDLPAEQYHAIKALSAGMIWTLDSECPLKAWLGSPWNPNREPVNNKHFDIGTAVHLAVLEPHRLDEKIVAHQFDKYTTNEARTVRDGAYAAGKTPLKPEEFAVVEGMRDALVRREDIWRLFADGDSEISMTWDWNGIPCKLRADRLNNVVIDLKSAATANPSAIARKAEAEGWFVRAAWYLDGVKAATGKMPDAYKFVVVEKDPPHIAEVFEIDERALIQGERIIQRSLSIAEECFAKQRWPTYSRNGAITLRRPRWAEFEWADREEAGEV